MSYNNGPRIVTSGLVMYLDAGNRRSFVSGSSTWNDLSRNGNTANASGTPVFSTDGNGCFDFATATGVNANGASMGFTFNSDMVTTTGNFTFECWIKNPPASNQQGMFANAPGGDGYRFGPSSDGVYYLIAPTYAEGTITWPGGNLNSSLWYHVVATWDRESAKRVNTYLNGVYQNFGTMPASQTAFTARTPGIVKSACCTVYTGKLAVMKVYNKLLSDSEILQNYHATKGRFGL
jgi:hypothetical protein